MKTTHEICENVYFMFNNKICKSIVTVINIEYSLKLHNPYIKDSDVGEEKKERYEVKGYLSFFKHEELFKTKNELIESLN